MVLCIFKCRIIVRSEDLSFKVNYRLSAFLMLPLSPNGILTVPESTGNNTVISGLLTLVWFLVHVICQPVLSLSTVLSGLLK